MVTLDLDWKSLIQRNHLVILLFNGIFGCSDYHSRENSKSRKVMDSNLLVLSDKITGNIQTAYSRNHLLEGCHKFLHEFISGQKRRLILWFLKGKQRIGLDSQWKEHKEKLADWSEQNHVSRCISNRLIPTQSYVLKLPLPCGCKNGTFFLTCSFSKAKGGATYSQEKLFNGIWCLYCAQTEAQIARKQTL